MQIQNPCVFYCDSEPFISLAQNSEIIPNKEDCEENLAFGSAEHQFKKSVRRLVTNVQSRLETAEQLTCNSSQTRNTATQANSDLRAILGNFNNRTTNETAAKKLMSAANKIGSINFAPSLFTADDFETTPKVDMEVRKSEFARCVQMSMDPESPFGAMPCLSNHSKGLSESEKKELEAFEPNAIMGKAINDLAVIPAIVSKTVNAIVGGAVKGLMLSAMSEAALNSDPYHYDQIMKDARRALNGENPEFNQSIKEITPTWILKAQDILEKIDRRLDLYDNELHKEYRTIQGLPKMGIYGGAELLIGAATGHLLKGAKSIVPIIAKSAPTVEKTVKATVEAPLKANKAFPIAEKINIHIKSKTAIFDKAEDMALRQAWVSAKGSLASEDKELVIKIAKTLRAENRLNKATNLKAGVKQKEIQVNKIDQQFLKNFKETTLPNHFPKDVAESLVKWEHSGSLVYTSAKKDVVFFLPSVLKHGSVENTLNSAVKLAGRQKFNRVFVVWDPLTHPIGSVVDKTQAIIGAGKLARGEFTPFNLIEIKK